MFADLSYDERELLILLGKGDEAAFTRLFHHYRNWVYSVAFKLSGSSILAEEVLQDVFLKIWLKRTDLSHVENFKAYLYTIVQNTVYKILKRMATSHLQTLPVTNEQSTCTADAEVQLIQKEYHSILEKGIEMLPNQQKQVYRLIRERGLKRREVASMLNLQPETVKYHLSQAVKNLWSYCRLHLPFLTMIGFVINFLFCSHSN